MATASRSLVAGWDPDNSRPKGVATAKDIPGENVVHMHDRTMPLLAEIGGEIRYRGEPVGVVAAKTYERAAEAAQRIRIDIDELPPLLTLEEAVAIFKATPEKLDSMKNQSIEKGDLAAGFAAAAVLSKKKPSPYPTV